MASLLRLAIVLAIAALASAWGQDGHHITCMIAEPRLTPEAQEAIKQLLPHGDFVQLCSWADEVRRSYRFRFTGPLHYIDTPDGLCTYDYERDCHNEHGEKDMCVTGAINNYTSQLETYSDQPDFRSRFLSLKNADTGHNLTEALLFLAHYMGDIHQPLHVGFTSDAGGNGVHVYWFGRKSNLHHIWDSEFINSAKRMYSHNIRYMADALSKNISSAAEISWSSCDGDQAACTDGYATESIEAACSYAYKDASSNSHLSEEYLHSRLPVVEQRLAQGGVRLAALLNRIFAKDSSEQTSAKSRKLAL